MRKNKQTAFAIGFAAVSLATLGTLLAVSAQDGGTAGVSQEAIFQERWAAQNPQSREDVCGALVLFGVDGMVALLDSDPDVPDNVDTEYFANRLNDECRG